MVSNEIIESAVLFFLHDKVDVMKNYDILSIPSSSYNEDEMKTSKTDFV